MTAPAVAAPQAGTASTQPVTVKVTESPGTEYIVLRRSERGWEAVKPVTARTPEVAIKEAHGTGDAAVYVAIPTRSWKPVKVTPKVETTLVVEAAKS